MTAITLFVYPTPSNEYLKLSLAHEERAPNIGCLQHISNSGTLNVKKELKQLIDSSVSSPLKYMPFIPTPSGSTRDHGGTAYVGFYICRDIPQAIDLLRLVMSDCGGNMILR